MSYVTNSMVSGREGLPSRRCWTLSPISLATWTEGLISCLTTTDTSKAFDSVQHGRLLDKLGWYGVDDHWFRDWLGNRQQRVRGGSTTVPITHGVIQGSILGPVLFLLFYQRPDIIFKRHEDGVVRRRRAIYPQRSP